MSSHDDTEEATAPSREAYVSPDEEPTNLIDEIPDDLRRSAAIVLGEEADADDLTAPTRVRDDELRAAIAATQAPKGAPPSAPLIEERTEVNVVRTADLTAAAKPSPPAVAPARPQAPRAPIPAADTFSEDEPTQAQVFRTADLDAAAQGTAGAPQNPFTPPSPAGSPFGPPRPYDAHQPAPPQPSERPDPTRARPNRREEPVGLAAEPSWSAHVDDSPIVQPRKGPPTGFGPAVNGPTRHPGAPIKKGDMSYDTLIKQQLADGARPLTADEADAVTNNMLMVGIAASFVLAFLLFATGFSTVLMIIAFIVVTGLSGAISRQYPELCESFLNVLSIQVRKE